MSRLTGIEVIYDGFFLCEPHPSPKILKNGVICRSFAKKRGLRPGSTVKDALEAALAYRDANKPDEVLHIAVCVRRADGIGARYSAKVAPGQMTTEWEMSG